MFEKQKAKSHAHKEWAYLCNQKRTGAMVLRGTKKGGFLCGNNKATTLKIDGMMNKDGGFGVYGYTIPAGFDDKDPGLEWGDGTAGEFFVDRYASFGPDPVNPRYDGEDDFQFLAKFSRVNIDGPPGQPITGELALSFEESTAAKKQGCVA